jgi:hypothetical protein
MAHIAHQPGPVCLESGVSRWLVGVVGLGAELLQGPQAARGALLHLLRLAKKNARRPDLPELLRKAWPGWLSYAACPWEGGGSKAVTFHNPQALSDVQEEENLGSARGGNRKTTGADTPTATALSALSCEQGALCYIHQRDLRGNPFRPSEKAISRGDELCM